MSRLRRQDGTGWIDEGPRAANPGLVGWSLEAHQGPTSASRSRARDIESGDYRNYAAREEPAELREPVEAAL